MTSEGIIAPLKFDISTWNFCTNSRRDRSSISFSFNEKTIASNNADLPLPLPPTITFSLSDNSNSIKLFFFIQRRSSDNLIDLIFSDGLCDGLLSFSYIILSGSLPASSNPLNELRHRKYWCGLFI